jgi:broad specificity phosphatase PhoE
VKPDRIILIRHGQSEGNVDKTIYAEKPDYALTLTAEGIAQADARGHELRELIGAESIQWYLSPFFRTRETFIQLAKVIGFDQCRRVYEDPRLREQEWGHLHDLKDYGRIEDDRDKYGHFYYRFPDGESCADVYDRMSDFFQTLHRDFEKVAYPQNTVIVTHGMTMRLFLMRWFHLTVEQFERLGNPKNADWYILERVDNTDRYRLVTPPRLHKVGHGRQFESRFHWEKDYHWMRE